jgi:phosphohistidine phosphatase SixA
LAVVKVYVVRHADAGDREAWTRPDIERPLSEKGWRQARGLVNSLAGAKFERILSSPYLRCRQTVEPLGQAREMAIDDDPRLEEGSSWRDAVALITALEAPAVLCSQGDVIASVVDDLVRGGLVAPREARWQKASTWVLSVKSGEIQKAEYLPPPAV